MESLILAQAAQESGGSFLEALPGLIVMIIVGIAVIGGMWKIFTKAGEPGWASIIPIYNIIVLLKVAGRPAWWFLLFLIPVVNVIISFIVYIDLAKSFGKGTGFGIGMALLPVIFIPILGFGSAQYQGA